MRIDVPQDLPRPRGPGAPVSTPPLEASPIEKRRENLVERAQQHRGPQKPPHSRERDRSNQRPPEPKRSVDQQHPSDCRPRRNDIPNQMVGVSLREEEGKVLAEVGRFRVIATRDLTETIYDGRRSRMERDLAFLKEKGLVQVDSVNARRDGRGGRIERLEVVTLTKDGRDVARQTSGLPQEQRLYAGMVKPREAEHDAQIYRAYRKEVERIEQKGGTNLRVQLDFELKSDIQKAIHAARKAEPDRDMAEIKKDVAGQFELPYVDNSIQIPDARIEYDMDQGSRTGHEDIEVLTAAYHAGHLRSKAQAGFRNYASSADRSSLSAKIEDDSRLMENILEL
jgi:hypothetical protein